jgi:hypothetical protein
MKWIEKNERIRQEEGVIAAAKHLYHDFVPINLVQDISNDLPKAGP